MKVLHFDNEQDWLDARKRKITGSTAYDVMTLRGTSKKMGYYQLIADRITVSHETENPLERGHRLEPIAIEEFTKVTGLEVDNSLQMWLSDENENIALSPDGKVIDKEEAVEVKCLHPALHIKTYLTQKVPTEYEYQGIQYFIVNEKLEKLHFVFYNPNLIVHKLFIIEITRKQVQKKIDDYKQKQKEILLEVEEIVKSLTF